MSLDLKNIANLSRLVQEAADTLNLLMGVAFGAGVGMEVSQTALSEVSRAFPCPLVQVVFPEYRAMHVSTASQPLRHNVTEAVDDLNTAMKSAWVANLLPVLIITVPYEDAPRVQALTFLDTRRLQWQKS